MQEKLKERAAMMMEVNSHQGSPSMGSVLKLINSEVEYLRLQNDTIPREQLEYNQGKIAAFLFMKSVIEKGAARK